ncbi:hypothetical protein P8452_43109 [Trifolium repens]|nr:hypothetical protein P8452_43109 [Trifolium repens]
MLIWVVMVTVDARFTSEGGGMNELKHLNDLYREGTICSCSFLLGRFKKSMESKQKENEDWSWSLLFSCEGK